VKPEFARLLRILENAFYSGYRVLQKALCRTYAYTRQRKYDKKGD
jgi:hypothetical protein